jgi:hypothetical protein
MIDQAKPRVTSGTLKSNPESVFATLTLLITIKYHVRTNSQLLPNPGLQLTLTSCAYLKHVAQRFAMYASKVNTNEHTAHGLNWVTDDHLQQYPAVI